MKPLRSRTGWQKKPTSSLRMMTPLMRPLHGWKGQESPAHAGADDAVNAGGTPHSVGSGNRRA